MHGTMNVDMHECFPHPWQYDGKLTVWKNRQHQRPAWYDADNMQTRHTVTDVHRPAAISAEQVWGPKPLADAEVHAQPDCLEYAANTRFVDPAACLPYRAWEQQ